jgi:transcriptional regulator with XRE-family HTH domain
MRKFRRNKVPNACSPIVKELFSRMNEEMMCIVDVAERSGVSVRTIKGWKESYNPTVNNLIACLNVLGYDLRVTRIPVLFAERS